jgi:Ca-activated chloride channel family protein
VPAKPRGDGHAAIAALFAREHVADLETRWTIGDTNAIDREIETVGVEFQIATRLTSWVAVDMVRRVDKKGPSRHQNVPQNLPYGTRAESFGLRTGSVTEEITEDESAAYDLRAPAPARHADVLEALDYGEEAPSEIFGGSDFTREETTGRMSDKSVAAPQKEAEPDTSTRRSRVVRAVSKIPRSADEPAPPPAPRPAQPTTPPAAARSTKILLGGSPQEEEPDGELERKAEPKEPAKPGAPGPMRAAPPQALQQPPSSGKGGMFQRTEAPSLVAPSQQMKPKRGVSLWLALILAIIVLALLAYWLVR